MDRFSEGVSPQSCGFSGVSGNARSLWQSEGQGFDPPQLHQSFRGVGAFVVGPVFCWSRIEPFCAVAERCKTKIDLFFALRMGVGFEREHR